MITEATSIKECKNKCCFALLLETNLLLDQTFLFYSLVTQHELRRLKEAYRRACIGHSMNLDTFIREVVGPGVPHSVAEVRWNVVRCLLG